MSLCMKLGQHQKIGSLFKEMKAKNIKPDNLTCCLLMTSCGALSKIDVVGEVLEEKDVVLGWSP
uniref:Pentatricopeptide repeat-containing protein n=3 Tax=Aegilops tauschii subsp. strangulata TaxID=200361 RepID=A0A453HXA0_AEGTS